MKNKVLREGYCANMGDRCGTAIGKFDPTIMDWFK
jgi:hypothetical protein